MTCYSEFTVFQKVRFLASIDRSYLIHPLEKIS